MYSTRSMRHDKGATPQIIITVIRLRYYLPENFPSSRFRNDLVFRFACLQKKLNTAELKLWSLLAFRFRQQILSMKLPQTLNPRTRIRGPKP